MHVSVLLGDGLGLFLLHVVHMQNAMWCTCTESRIEMHADMRQSVAPLERSWRLSSKTPPLTVPHMLLLLPSLGSGLLIACAVWAAMCLCTALRARAIPCWVPAGQRQSG